MKLLHVTCINGSSLHIFSRKFLPNNLVIILISSYARQSPYLVKGGFRSWVEEGFRVKELKTETTLVILSEVHNEFLTALLCCRKVSWVILLVFVNSFHIIWDNARSLNFFLRSLDWNGLLLFFYSVQPKIKGYSGFRFFRLS